jgi:hypothetical protein
MARERSNRRRGWAAIAIGASALSGGCGGDAGIRFEQGERSERVATAACRWQGFAFSPCDRRRFPETRLADLVDRPERPVRLRFSPSGRVEVHAYVVRGGRRELLTRWSDHRQCADSPCIDELPLPRPPSRADGLRILIPREDGDRTLDGFDLRLR